MRKSAINRSRSKRSRSKITYKRKRGTTKKRIRGGTPFSDYVKRQNPFYWIALKSVNVEINNSDIIIPTTVYDVDLYNTIMTPEVQETYNNHIAEINANIHLLTEKGVRSINLILTAKLTNTDSVTKMANAQSRNQSNYSIRDPSTAGQVNIALNPNLFLIIDYSPTCNEFNNALQSIGWTIR